MTEKNNGFTPPPERGPTGEVMEGAHTRVWRYVQVSVELTAREFGRDREERDLLVQAAHLELSGMDPTSCDVENEEDLMYLRGALRKHMRRQIREIRRANRTPSEEVPVDVARRLRGARTSAGEDEETEE